MDYSSLLPPTWKKTIELWLQEDIPSFDYAGFVVGDKIEQAMLLGKSKGILAGVPFFTEIFRKLDCKVEWLLHEGEAFDPVKEIATVTGNVKNILIGERTALNVLSRVSGISTQAKAIVELAKDNNFSGKIAGTRKTTPGFRLFEKYALLVAGADTHRMDLSSLIMLKDNHIASSGSITNAIERARSVGSIWLNIEVECQSQEDAEEAIEGGTNIVMLDNFSPEDLKKTAKFLKNKYSNRNFFIESSGGITRENINNYFSDSVDIISLGFLTQNVKSIDFSLKVQ